MTHMMRRLVFAVMLCMAWAGLGCAMAQEVTYYHTDALGTPVAISNSSGTVVERRTFEPFGRQLTPTTTADGPGYTGHVSDAATGLSYMQQRYYDPAIGTFLSTDAVSVDGSTAWNFCRYCYAANNPYKFKDPDGRIIDTIADVVFIAADIAEISSSGLTATNGLALVADVAGAFIPGATGLGNGVRGVSKAVEVYRGSRLARNMERAGNAVKKGEQEAHHIVAKADKRAAGSREILSRNGIDVHSADNGAAMAKADHRGVHTTEMHANVESRLQAAEARGTDASSRANEVRCELTCMRNELQSQGNLK